MNYFAKLIAVAAVVGCAWHPQQPFATDRACLQYGPAVVSLTGTITKHMTYGPPNYGEDPAHDSQEIYWYLDLDNPICVDGAKDNSPEAQGEKDVREVQIVYSNGYPKGNDWINHRAIITGTLFHAISGHHHTKVLIEASKTKKAGMGNRQ